jgi:adenylate kinase family enzyme
VSTQAQRIVIKGGSGSGKTTLGRALARRLDAPFIELDALVHGPNWVEASDEHVRAAIEAAIAGHDRWIIDGNYERKLGDFVNARADLIVWLDLPLPLKLARLWRRTRRYMRDQQPLWNGNRQTWRAAFVGGESLFVWTLRSHFRHRREWPRTLAGRRLVRLRTPAEVERWLSTF